MHWEQFSSFYNHSQWFNAIAVVCPSLHFTVDWQSMSLEQCSITETHNCHPRLDNNAGRPWLSLVWVPTAGSDSGSGPRIHSLVTSQSQVSLPTLAICTRLANRNCSKGQIRASWRGTIFLEYYFIGEMYQIRYDGMSNQSSIPLR